MILFQLTFPSSLCTVAVSMRVRHVGHVHSPAATLSTSAGLPEAVHTDSGVQQWRLAWRVLCLQVC